MMGVRNRMRRPVAAYITTICGAVYLLVFIKISSFIMCEKILLLKPFNCREDYHRQPTTMKTVRLPNGVVVQARNVAARGYGRSVLS